MKHEVGPREDTAGLTDLERDEMQHAKHLNSIQKNMVCVEARK